MPLQQFKIHVHRNGDSNNRFSFLVDGPRGKKLNLGYMPQHTDQSGNKVPPTLRLQDISGSKAQCKGQAVGKNMFGPSGQLTARTLRQEKGFDGGPDGVFYQLTLFSTGFDGAFTYWHEVPRSNVSGGRPEVKLVLNKQTKEGPAEPLATAQWKGVGAPNDSTAKTTIDLECPREQYVDVLLSLMSIVVLDHY